MSHIVHDSPPTSRVIQTSDVESTWLLRCIPMTLMSMVNWERTLYFVVSCPSTGPPGLSESFSADTLLKLSDTMPPVASNIDISCAMSNSKYVFSFGSTM